MAIGEGRRQESGHKLFLRLFLSHVPGVRQGRAESRRWLSKGEKVSELLGLCALLFQEKGQTILMF